MFIPIRTDRRLLHTPWVNYALIAANLLIFMATHKQVAQVAIWLERGMTLDDITRSYPVFNYYLIPIAQRLEQFITYQFLHGDIRHLAGNMVFLWVFGNSVEDRLGKVGYMGFYLAGGVIAGLGHALTAVDPVLGASGAVAAVTGAYLVLFPLSNITIVYFIVFFFGAFEASSIVLILFQIGYNIVMHLIGGGNVAYVAHLAGYAFGFGIAMALLGVRLLPREPYDLLAMIGQRRRRAQFRQVARDGHQPWQNPNPDDPPPSEGATPTLTERDQQIMALRTSITDAMGNHDLGPAADAYEQLLQIDDDQVMSQQQQLDISNQLMIDNRYDTAARAYELFLAKYKRYDQREQVELILALIYFRYLEHGQRARELLTAALPRLRDTEQKQLAEQMLADIDA